MFPTLGHLVNYIFGANIVFPMPTYGFVLVLAFLTGGLVIRQSFLYKERIGELTSKKGKKLVSGPINYIDILFGTLFSFVLGFKIGGVFTNYDLFVVSVEDYLFSMHGNIWIGLIVAIGSGVYSYRQAKKKESEKKVFADVDVFPHELWINIMVVAAFSGIIGAKVFDVIENLPAFFADPIDQLFSSGGFAFYGGLIFGVGAVAYYSKRNNISYLQVVDAAAPALLAAYAVGRMACMLSGDGCWGIPNLEPKPEMLAFLPNWMWAYDFPHNVMNDGILISNCTGDYCYVLDVPVFPTPFYESTLSAMFFGLLWFLQRRVKVGGVIFFLALIFNGFARFFIEKIRVNNTYEVGSFNITQAEIISSFLVVGGLIGILLMYRFNSKGKSVENS